MLRLLPRDCGLGAVVPVDSYDHWVASYRYYSCDVSCGGRYIVETVLYDVPSVVAAVSRFHCRRMDYGVLVVGGVSWELCRVLCRACSVWVSVKHTHTGQADEEPDNKIQKQQPQRTAHHTTRFQLYTVRHRIHRIYNNDTTQPNDRNYTSTGTTAPKPQFRGSRRNMRLSRTTHAQLEDTQQHTRIANDDQLTVSQHPQYIN